jgi:hypothetical protein
MVARRISASTNERCHIGKLSFVIPGLVPGTHTLRKRDGALRPCINNNDGVYGSPGQARG